MSVKRTLLITLVVVVLGVGALLNSQRFLLFAIHEAMDRFTDLHLVLRKPYLDVFSGTASVEQLQLFPDSGGPAIVSATGLHGELWIPDLWRGDLTRTSLAADTAQLYISERDSTDDPAPLEWLGYLTWLPQQLHVGNAYFILESLRTDIFTAQGIVGLRDTESSYHLLAESSVTGLPALLEIKLSALDRKKTIVGLDMVAELTTTDYGGWLTLDGQLRGNRTVFSYDFQLDAYSPDVTNMVNAFAPGAKVAGSLLLRGNMSGDTEGFVIRDAEARLDNRPAYGLDLEGILDYEFAGENSLRLAVTGEMSPLERLIDWIDVDLKTLRSASVEGEISGSLEMPYVDRFTVKASTAEGLQVTVRGAMPLDIFDEEITNEQDEVLVDIFGPSLGALEAWTGPLPYDPGPWKASAVLRPRNPGIAATNIIVDAGTGETLQLHAEGEVGHLWDIEKIGLAGLKDIRLELSAYSQSTAELARVFELEIPPFQAARAQWQMSGSGDDLRIEKGTANIKDSDLTLALSSLSLRLQPQAAIIASDLSTALNLSLSDTSALSQYIEEEVPVLGSLELNAMLSEQGENYQLSHISAHLTNSEGVDLRTTGSIEDLLSINGAQLNNQVSGISVHSLLERVREKFEYGGDLGNLTGNFVLSSENDLWDVSGLSLSVEDSPALQLSLQGAIKDLLNQPDGELQARIHTDDQELLAAFTGLRMQTLRAKATLKTAGESMDFDLKGAVGESEIDIMGTLVYDGEKINGLSVGLTSPRLVLQDFDLQAREEESGETYSPAEQIGDAVTVSVLEKLVEKVPKYPTDITLDIGSISGDVLDLGQTNIHLTGQDGVHTLRRFTLYYDRTVGELRGVIDLNPDPPVFSLGGEFLAIDMNSLVADLGIDSDIEGKLTIRAGVTAAGNSTEELLADMGGSLAMALENAEVQGAAYDVLATDFLGWIYTGAALEESTYIECTRALFDLSNGLARSDNLFMETRRMVARGEGELNLVDGTLDLSITPKSKTRIGQIPSSVKISGPIEDPSVEVSAIRTGANLYSEFLLIVPNFFMQLFRIERTSGEGSCLAKLYE